MLQKFALRRIAEKKNERGHAGAEAQKKYKDNAQTGERHRNVFKPPLEQEH